MLHRGLLSTHEDLVWSRFPDSRLLDFWEIFLFFTGLKKCNIFFLFVGNAKKSPTCQHIYNDACFLLSCG